MDNKSTWAKKTGVTSGKLALIGVLTVVLAGVLYLQFGRSSKKASSGAVPPIVAAESSSGPRGSTAAANTIPQTATAPRKKTGKLASWQSPELVSVVKYDPFALPASFPQPRPINDTASTSSETQTLDDLAQQAALEAARTKSQSELQGMRQQGVHAIIKKKKEYVALVGDQEVHVGDQINGFTVIAIDADGVRVAKDLGP